MELTDDHLARHEPSPDPRVVLALERTTLAWTRTALALMGFGFVVGRLGLFLRELHPQTPTSGGAPWIGLAIVLLGGVVQGGALIAHAQSIRRLRSGRGLPLRVISPATVLGAILMAVAIAMTWYLARLQAGQ